jgi:hypothetical protein
MMLAEPLSLPSWSHHPYAAHAFFVPWFCRLFTLFLSLRYRCGIEVQMLTCIGAERAGPHYIFWGLIAVLMKILTFWGITPCRFVLGTNVTFQRYIGLHWRCRQWNCMKCWYLIQIYTGSYPRKLTLCTQDNHNVYQHKFTTGSEQKTELLAHRIRLFQVL